MDLIEIKGIGAGRVKMLQGMGIKTTSDLISYYPRDYDDRSQIKTISSLIAGTTQTIRCKISREAENAFLKIPVTKLRLSDETGDIELIWFRQPYLKKAFKKNAEYVFTGRVNENYGRLQMESPEYEEVTEEESLSAGRIVPVYTLPKGISQKMFRKWMKSAIDAGGFDFKENLPEGVRGGFISRHDAMINIHFPKSSELFYAARRRLVFEELFFMQIALLKLKGEPEAGVQLLNTDVAPFLAQLPFELTPAQHKVLGEIFNDVKSGYRMARLIQGDVGSGKTVVAAAAAYPFIQAGYQAAIMAPTEVLAAQHYIKQYMGEPMENPVLLTGSLPAKEKRDVLEKIKSGAAKLIIGTHALIQETVKFHNLALVITDEQHRFGVNQRAALSDKGAENAPHILIMTATPIPRTLGLILYGDMDVSVIDNMPPGRTPIETFVVTSAYRQRLTAFIEKTVNEGRQVFIVCPAIDEADDMQTVVSYTAKLKKTLPEIPIACMHGRLKGKDEIMAAFAAGEYKILVSTTVIEVGVDVPNAVLMVIENAERFGLAQLHQLRGRVGRGEHKSYCVLVTDSKTEQTRERMNAMKSTTDGFVLSELDLKMRGPGDFFGVRQHGLPDFAITNLYRDMDILKEAQKAVQDFIS